MWTSLFYKFSRTSTIPGVIATLAMVVLAPAKTAQACSKSHTCDPSSVAPAVGVAIPATSPALVLTPSTGTPFEQIPQLLNEKGEEVARNVVGEYPARLLLPLSPLQANKTYRLQFLEGCEKPGVFLEAGTSKVLEQPIAVGQEAVLPLASGVLSVLSQELKTVQAYHEANCYTSFQAATATLGFVPSAELEPFLPVTQIVVTVDGIPWTRSSYGSSDPPAARSSISTSTTRRPLVIFTACESVDSLTDKGVPEGDHVVSVQAHIAGASSDPAPATTTVAVRCNGVVADAGAEVQPDAPSDTVVEQDSEVDTTLVDSADDAAEGPPSAEGGGCSVPGRLGTSSSATAIAWMSLAGLLRKWFARSSKAKRALR